MAEEIIKVIAAIIAVLPPILVRIITPKKVPKRLVIAVIISGISVICLIIVLRIIPLEIEITYPKNEDTVSQNIKVEGYVNKKLPEDKHLYIVVQWGHLCWPQKRERGNSEISPGYSQTNKRWEFGTSAEIGQENDTDEEFNVLAILADEVSHAFISGYIFRQSAIQNPQEEEEDYPGIDRNELFGWGEIDTRDEILVIRE